MRIIDYLKKVDLINLHKFLKIESRYGRKSSRFANCSFSRIIFIEIRPRVTTLLRYTATDKKIDFGEAALEGISTLIRLRCAARIYLRIVTRAGVRNAREEHRMAGGWGRPVREGGQARLGDTRVVEGRTIEGGGRGVGWGEESEGTERKRDREHNVSHSARSCIFYDMASNLTSRARHNSRPRVLRAPLPPPLGPFLSPSLSRRSCVRACAPNARAHEESPRAHVRACACTRTCLTGQVRVRPSASKPLEW